jgi:UDP-2,4-diacetamido-2,4,6-trideoxy-beta-L-altropyranose hydrolase
VDSVQAIHVQIRAHVRLHERDLLTQQARVFTGGTEGHARSRVLLRADGGKHIGLGHVFRCVALAAGLKELGFETILALRADGFRPEDLDVPCGIYVISIPSGRSYEDDALLTLDSAIDNQVDWIVVDQCHSSIPSCEEFDHYLSSLRGKCNTVCIAGSEGIDFDADLIVSPYYREAYPPFPANSRSEYLLGPDFFVFREEFRQAATCQPKTTEFARRVLVTIGGADEYGATEKVARSLARYGGENLIIRFILGPTYPKNTEEHIRQAMLGMGVRFEVVSSCHNMADEMMKAEIAVIGDGLTKYEGAVLGIPCITLSRPNSDESINAEFAQVGSSLHLGDVTLIDEENLGREILSACGNRDRRLQMAKRGKSLVDGGGISRIAEAMQSRNSRRAFF